MRFDPSTSARSGAVPSLRRWPPLPAPACLLTHKLRSTGLANHQFVKDAPRTLRTNLIKLAKKNGHDLGFLA